MSFVFLSTMLIRANHNKNSSNSNMRMRRLDLRVLFLVVIFLNGRTTQALIVPSSRFCPSPLFSQPPINNQESSSSSSSPRTTALISSLDDAVHNRYACTRFQRFDGRNATDTTPSTGDMSIVQTAYECLDLARRAPTGFNIQPYKLLLVKSPEQKAKMARYCIGHNAHRVRDSDCTVVFLADRQVVQEVVRKDFQNQLKGDTWKGWKLFKLRLLIAMFSSGFPFPKWISGPLSWGIRLAMRVVSWMTRGWLPVPTLSSSETWSQKNTMMVAMTYLLACTSRNIATCPMEGYMAWGIRQSLNIPRRYTIPLIVATGTPFIRTNSNNSTTKDQDDAGMTHGRGKDLSTPRFAKEQMIYGDVFGQEVGLME
jgi:nitroreductase